jgi:hypothetical protein
MSGIHLALLGMTYGGEVTVIQSFTATGEWVCPTGVTEVGSVQEQPHQAQETLKVVEEEAQVDLEQELDLQFPQEQHTQ